MGLMDLLRKMTTVPVDSLISDLEDPALMLPQLLQEFSEKMALASNAEAKALSAIRAAQRRVDETRGRILRLAQGAELAVQRGDDALAREALAAQVAGEQTLARHQEALALAERAWRDAGEVRAALANKHQELQERRAELMARARTTTVDRRVQQVETAARALEQAAHSVDEEGAVAESLATLQRLNSSDPVRRAETRLAALEKDAAIEERLRKLREQRSS